jgi:hypothetical protein
VNENRRASWGFGLAAKVIVMSVRRCFQHCLPKNSQNQLAFSVDGLQQACHVTIWLDLRCIEMQTPLSHASHTASNLRRNAAILSRSTRTLGQGYVVCGTIFTMCAK